MSTEHFTTEETAGDTSGSYRLMWRFVRSVPFLMYLLVPNLVLAVLGAAGAQAFVWLSGALAECSARGDCAPLTTIFGQSLTPSFQLLGFLALAVFLVRVVQWNLFETGGQIASQGLFRRMVHGVGRVRTTFFDEYPSGKIINRLVKDADNLRLFGPIRIGDTTTAIVELASIAGVIWLASPSVALVAVPAFLIFLFIQRNVAPMLQKLLVLRSARFGEVLHRETDVIEGARCFALYGQIPALMSRLGDAAFRFMQMHFMRGRVEAWGRCLSDLGVAIFSSLVLVAVYLGVHSGSVSPVIGVVIITASFRLGTTFSWLTWSLGLLFEVAGHARRVFEYVDLPVEESQEGNVPLVGQRPSPDVVGDLVFERYSMSYRSTTPIILDGLSLTIRRGSKVGLVGRTGAGKSSLVQSLYRMVYVRGGDIRVGDASLFALPIKDSRELFAVVPQDPYLFEGTVRDNLDRLGEFSDERVREALQAVQLPFDLSMQLLEGGSNLSLGQRQLICLARVILSKRPFIIMDEPTSGVDTITDAIMQSVLRSALADRTILTIAHRLETLARMDRIIELDNGRVVRDGAPAAVIHELTPEELM